MLLPCLLLTLATTSSVCVVSIVRLVVLSRLEAYDVTWNYVNAAIWSAAEPSMGVIAACIPSLRPLFALVWKGSHRGPFVDSNGDQTYASSNSSRSIWPSHGKDEAQPVGRFRRLEDLLSSGDRGRWGHEANIDGGKRQGTTSSEEVGLGNMNDRMGGIRVKNEIIITSHVWDYKDRLY